MNNIKIFHYYHIYANGSWFPAVNEHISAAKHSGLLKNLHEMKIGIVGDLEERLIVKDWLLNNGVDYSIIAEEDIGWEQVTLNKLYEDSKSIDGYVLYAHTKGSANRHISSNTPWRRTMCYYNVIHWRNCVKELANNDICGIYWMEMPEQPEHVDHKWFFAGTYWWANMKYIRELPPLLMNHRWNAEGWIGMSKKQIKVRDFAPGWDDARKNNTEFPPMEDAFLKENESLFIDLEKK